MDVRKEGEELDKKFVENEKKKSLNYSIKEGSFASVSTGAGEAYVVPYALAMNANNIQVGFLSSFVGLIGAASQIFGSKLMFKYSRKKLIVTFVSLQAFMWLVVMSIGYLYWNNSLTSFYAVSLLILFYTIYAVFGSLAGPPWFSLMGDLAPEKERGKYFSKRNSIGNFVSVVVTLLAALFLDYVKELGILIFGFVILLTISSFARFISAWYFTKHYYPELKIQKESYFSFSQFLKKAPGNNFGKFVIFIGLINIATHFAGPFFAVYMLKELGYSYFWFTVVNIAGTFFLILSIPIWGRIGDNYGNRELLKVGAIIIPFASFLWIFSDNPYFLIFTAQLASGFGWAAFNLASSNFIYDAVTAEKRGLCVAYYNMINGISIFIGAGLGGLFAYYFKGELLGLNVFLLIFLISALLRVVFALIMIPMIKEVRPIDSNQKNLGLFGYIHLFTVRPLHDLFRGAYSIIPQFENLNKKGALKFEKKDFG